MKQQPFSLPAKTNLGWWSVGLIIIMPILFILGASFTTSIYPSIPAGETLLADIAGRPALALTMLAGMAAGVSAFITGLLAIFRKKEKALLVYLSTGIGGLLTLYLLGEVFFQP